MPRLCALLALLVPLPPPFPDVDHPVRYRVEVPLDVLPQPLSAPQVGRSLFQEDAQFPQFPFRHDRTIVATGLLAAHTDRTAYSLR